MTAPPFPAAQWRELLRALCSDDPKAIGTLVEAEPLAHIGPTRFEWLTGVDWRPVGDEFGIAILDLAHPGAHSAAQWTAVCGPLLADPVTPGSGPVLQGVFHPADLVNRAAVYLTVDRASDDTTGLVTEVRIRVEPV